MKCQASDYVRKYPHSKSITLRAIKEISYCTKDATGEITILTPEGVEQKIPTCDYHRDFKASEAIGKRQPILNSGDLWYLCPCGLKNKADGWAAAHWSGILKHACVCGLKNTLLRGEVLDSE